MTVMIGEKLSKYNDTPEFLDAKARLGKIYDDARKPHWERFCSKEIDYDTYCDLIDPHRVEYANNLNPYWVKTGRPSIGKQRTRAEVQAEYDAKSTPTEEEKLNAAKYFASLKCNVTTG